MPKRSVLNSPDWFSAYIASLSSGIGENILPLPTLPSGVNESVALNTFEQAIVARSAPIISYINTGARQVSFTIALADDYMPTRGEDGTQYTLHEYINTLKSMLYPNYESESEIVVPQCVLKIGNVKLKGILTSVQVNWNGPVSNALYSSSSSGTFTRADVSLQFKEISSVVKGSVQIMRGD